MWVRLLIAYVAKKIYKKSFNILRIRLQNVYANIVSSEFSEENNILEKLLISGEDHRFKYHIGFDIIAIIRAIRNRLFYKKIEGASTIEQQLVRVLLNDFEKSFKRKIREIFLSTTLADLIPKKKIPFLYLQVAYFGTNMIGLNQALLKFKISDKRNVTKEIAAEIISRIKYPESESLNQKRFVQIAVRKQHLLNLYQRHSSRKFIPIYG